MFDVSLAADIFENTIKPIMDTKNNGVTIVGIDGPTAAGKTILANNVQTLVQQAGRECWVYRVDWALEERELRVQDLGQIKARNVRFDLEAELHMRLHIVKSFLQKARSVEAKFDENSGNRDICLSELYSRDNGGTLSGKEKCTLSPGMVILVEGHYTLRSELHTYLDQNIVLLASPEELVQRKKDRVKGYRGAEEAEDYFWRIDLPSFQHHLKRFLSNADAIYDNTNIQTPVSIGISQCKTWGETAEVKGTFDSKPQSGLSIEEIVDNVLPHSVFLSLQLRAATIEAVEALIQWDNSVSMYLRTSLESIKFDLRGVIRRHLDELNTKFSSNCTFSLQYSNALHNIYARKVPISVGIEIVDIKKHSTLRIIAEVHNNHATFAFVWAGGVYRYSLNRELGQIQAKGTHEFAIAPLVRDEKELLFLTPTPFIRPAFIEGLAVQPVYTGMEDTNYTASEAFVRILEDGGCWIHRFATFKELRFFVALLENAGASVMKVGNYLIALFHSDSTAKSRFREFRKKWDSSHTRGVSPLSSENAYDAIIEKERVDAARFIQDYCPDFYSLDGALHCPNLGGGSTSWERILTQVKTMLRCKQRLIRKQVLNFILLRFPRISMPTSELWPNLQGTGTSEITLNNYLELSPSILAEVYLWLELREDSSAVLGANIYDIRKNSADCAGYLRAAQELNTPVVLQSSLNALGQLEQDFEGNTYHGYLKPENGVGDLIESAYTAAIRLFLETGKRPPLYGIGLDHISVAQNNPSGRARRFFQQAFESSLVTHYTLDGSPLFDAADRSDEELQRTYFEICHFALGLIGEDSSFYKYDQEICAGEMNYIGNQKQAMIPTPRELELFAQVFESCCRLNGLEALNVRPRLFVANVGTTHHGADTSIPEVARSEGWVESLKKYNFISAVLHGTTNSHRDTLAQATRGCHKVNVAGDLLHTIISNLPLELSRRITELTNDPKRALHTVREEMDSLAPKDADRLVDALEAHAHSLMETIQSPKLTNLDRRYFHYKAAVLPDAHVDILIEQLRQYSQSMVAQEVNTPVDGRYGYEFVASMIEVPYDENYGELIEVLWKEGIHYYHIDVGDGAYIPRQIDALEKVAFLKKHYPESKLHAHFMAKTPHLSVDGNVPLLEQYIKAGCDAVAVHIGAFDNYDGIRSAAIFSRNLGARFGIVLETSDVLSHALFNFMNEIEVDWVVLMGVPIGFGGQMFDFFTLQRLSELRKYAESRPIPLLIESDGGLTLSTLGMCKKSGAQFFSGWSIVKGPNLEVLRENVRKVQAILKAD